MDGRCCVLDRSKVACSSEPVRGNPRGILASAAARIAVIIVRVQDHASVGSGFEGSLIELSVVDCPVV